MANKINITIVSIVAMLATPVNAQITDVTRADQWIVTHKAGYTYLMPPIECRTGPHPDFTVISVPQADLDMSLTPAMRAKGQHFFAIHTVVDDGLPYQYKNVHLSVYFFLCTNISTTLP